MTEIELDRLGRMRQIGDTEHGAAVLLAQIGEDLPIARVEKAQGSGL